MHNEDPDEESKGESASQVKPQQDRPKVPLFPQPDRVDSSVQPVDSPEQPALELKPVQPSPMKPVTSVFASTDRVDSSVQQVDSPEQPAQELKPVQPLPMKSVTSVFEGADEMVKIVTSGVESGA